MENVTIDGVVYEGTGKKGDSLCGAFESVSGNGMVLGTEEI